jgi:hypothetical protein
MPGEDLRPGDAPAVEPPGVATRAIVTTTVGILAILIAIAFGFQLIFHDRIDKTYVERHSLPSPGVVPDERARREATEERQRAALAGAGQRLPIEAAMRAIADKGEHAFDPVGVTP